MKKRVIFFIDGFNLYHSIKDLKKNYLKWLDLRKLCSEFAPDPYFSIVKIYYFSAFAKWRKNAYKRHREFVKALESVDVGIVLGNFKEKHWKCCHCKRDQLRHEEKETDVNIAVYLLAEAFNDNFDRAIIVSADSDLAPAIKKVKELFPQKEIRILTPVGRKHSMALVNAAGGIKNAKKIKEIHLERSLFPAIIKNDKGEIIVKRPKKYDP